jgi:hypothetical protein
MAAIGGPSFWGAAVIGGCLVADAASEETDVLDVDKVLDPLVAVDELLDLLVALKLALDTLTLLIELVPPDAPYATLKASLSKYAGARLSLEQPAVLAHAPVLQHPRKAGVVKLQV